MPAPDQETNRHKHEEDLREDQAELNRKAEQTAGCREVGKEVTRSLDTPGDQCGTNDEKTLGVHVEHADTEEAEHSGSGGATACTLPAPGELR